MGVWEAPYGLPASDPVHRRHEQCALSCAAAKVYNPYLLINKKRYAGLLWTSPDKWDKMDAKVWHQLFSGM